MTARPSEIRARAKATRDAGALLRAKPLLERARWIVRAAALLRKDEPLGATARHELPGETGLSDAMVDWALETTMSTVHLDALLGLAQEAKDAHGREPDPVSLVSVILAGNVFTASLRGMFVPLLFGAPVLVKPSSNEPLFPSLLGQALVMADPLLAAAVDIVSFEGGSAAHEAAFLSLAETVSVFGSDETVGAIEAQVERNDVVISHGHGVSVAYCGAEAQASERVVDTADRLALDVATYDQRGCLSPQLVYLEDRGPDSAISFATRLSQALAGVGESLPRGALPPSVGAAQMQWRGLAEVEGVLLQGRDHAVAVGSGEVRWSPGYRNVSVVPVASLGAAVQSMRHVGTHLKCVGCDGASLRTVTASLREETTLHAYATPLGTMQTPAFDAPADGRPAWAGYVRRR